MDLCCFLLCNHNCCWFSLLIHHVLENFLLSSDWKFVFICWDQPFRLLLLFLFFFLSLLAKRDQPFRMAWLFAAFFFHAKAVGFALQYFTYVGDRRGAWSEMRTNPVYFTIEKLPILSRPTLFLGPLFSFLFFSFFFVIWIWPLHFLYVSHPPAFNPFEFCLLPTLISWIMMCWAFIICTTFFY